MLIAGFGVDQKFALFTESTPFAAKNAPS